jgi:hypothetical protein
MKNVLGRWEIQVKFYSKKTQWKETLRRSKSRRKGYIKMDFKEIICECVCYMNYLDP